MNKLNELIQKLCPDGLEYIKIGEVVDYEQPSKYIVESTDYSDIFDVPVLTAGQTFILGYTNEKNGIYNASKESPVIIFDDFTGAFKWVDFPFKVKSSAMKILTARSQRTFLRYIYHVMGHIGYSSTEHKRLWIGIYSEIKIHLPPMPVQEEIVRILDNFKELTTELTTELATELTARRQQYEHYSNILLSFDNTTYQTLEELCDIVDYRGKTPQKVDDGIFLVTAKNIRKGFIDYDKSKEYISPEDYDEVMHRGFPKIGDVLITTEAPCGNVAQIDNENIALAQRVIKYRPKSNNLNSTFLKYILLGKEFQDKLEKAATGGTVKGIKGSKLHQLTIPVPPIEYQERIVAILDNFSMLCNDLSAGLPAEIEARQKQYEYYRDKLLTFEEHKENAG